MSNCRLVLTCAIVVTLCVVLVGPMAAMAAPPAESAESDITVWDPREPTKDPLLIAPAGARATDPADAIGQRAWTVLREWIVEVDRWFWTPNPRCD